MSHTNVMEYLENTIAKDLFAAFAGECLGNGCARTVYVCAQDEGRVVKIETPSQSFQNVEEWNTWCDLAALPVGKKWLAPCHYISPCGTVLIQSRTYPAQKSRFPGKVPTFFTDTKYENWGLIGNKLVCHDYGYNNARLHGLGQMRKADWSNGDGS